MHISDIERLIQRLDNALDKSITIRDYLPENCLTRAFIHNMSQIRMAIDYTIDELKEELENLQK